MKKDKYPNPDNDRIFDQFYDMTSVQSTTEMTGLTPTPPITEEDAISYSGLHGMPVPGDPPQKRQDKKENPDEPWLHQ